MRTNETIGCPDKLGTIIVMLLLAFVLPVQAHAQSGLEESDEINQSATIPNTIPDTAPETTSEEQPTEHKDSCQFWGNSFSLKFHIKSCPFAQAMNPVHVQFLKSVKEALTLGEKPCRYCLPPYELSVSCKILGKTYEENQSDNSAESKSEKR